MTKKIRPFETGYFSIHNGVFDVIMPRLSANGWKVLCVAIRQTLGWVDKSDPSRRRESDVISYSQFQEKAGIGSRHTVSRAVRECLEAGYLVRREIRKHQGTAKPIYAYALNTGYELELDDASAESALAASAETALASAESAPAASAETALTKRKKNKKKQQQQTVAAVSLTEDEQKAFDALEDRGFTPKSDAMEYARTYPEAAYRWAVYAKREGLGAGFVRKRLDNGDDPPPVEPETRRRTAPGGVFR
jgi:hypothetical protein